MINNFKFREVSRINENNQKEISNLAHRINEIDKENWILRKDKEMQNILIEKQLKKIRDLNEIVHSFNQQNYEGENGKMKRNF